MSYEKWKYKYTNVLVWFSYVLGLLLGILIGRGIIGWI